MSVSTKSYEAERGRRRKDHASGPIRQTIKAKPPITPPAIAPFNAAWESPVLAEGDAGCSELDTTVGDEVVEVVAAVTLRP